MEAWQRGRTDREERLFHLLFELQSGFEPGATADDLTFTLVEFKPSVIKYDLTLIVSEEGRELAANIEYNADLFSPGWIEKLLDDFRLVLLAMVRDPDCDVDALEVGAGAVRLDDALLGNLELDEVATGEPTDWISD
jgi:non-ribosomal peptide synthetase component F